MNKHRDITDETRRICYAWLYDQIEQRFSNYLFDKRHFSPYFSNIPMNRKSVLAIKILLCITRSKTTIWDIEFDMNGNSTA